MLTQRFKPDDDRRESAFQNYAGMNPAFVGFLLVAGYFQLTEKLPRAVPKFATLATRRRSSSPPSRWRILADPIPAARRQPHNTAGAGRAYGAGGAGADYTRMLTHAEFSGHSRDRRASVR